MKTRHLARAWLSLPLAVWLLPHPAAASPITLDGSSDQVSLMEHLDVLPDPGGDLGIEQVAARDFHSLNDLANDLGRWPGEPPEVVWMRFVVRVSPGAAREDWNLIIGRPFDPGTVFVEQEAGRFRRIPLGIDENGGSGRAELSLQAGTCRVFLRVPGPVSRPSLLHVATAAGEERLTKRLLTEQGLYLGVILAMLIVNLLMGVVLRDRTHLWYVGFISTSAAAFSLLMGTANRFVLPTVPAVALFRPQMACLALMVLAGIQFSRLFLDTPRTAPRWDRVMRAYLAFAVVVLVAVGVAPDLLALQAVSLLGVLVPFVALSAGVAAWRAGSRWARFYLLGWSLFTVGGFLFALPIPVRFVDTLWLFQLSSACEAALLSVALVDRMRILRTERTQAELKLARAEKLAALGQLVAGVAHEVSNPNNFLTFNLPILRDYVAAIRPHVEEAARGKTDVRFFGMTVDEFFADMSSLIGNMQHGTERIAGIVSQLRSYVRQNDEAQWEEADVNRVVDNATTLVRTQLLKSVAQLDVHLGEGLPLVRMNPGRIEQVVINLLLNAGHAAGKSPNGRVVLRTARDDGHVRISVEDNGPGVPQEIRDRIFEPFFTTKSGDQGTGMGLAISQRIVDEHRGTLELASEVGAQTCFVVRLPVTVEQT